MGSTALWLLRYVRTGTLGPDVRPSAREMCPRTTIAVRSGRTAAPGSRERSRVTDDEIRARFDGRGCVELLPGGVSAAKRRRMDEIAHALGYRLRAVEELGLAGVRLVYDRDDGPQARRRSELTIARLREGGQLLPAVEPPPPPPPGRPQGSYDDAHDTGR
ncbi:hypothetical protein ABZ946_18075 [Streptomyces sp. NPDC046324]|uniref:hypothetical protein n=1 Tax=Streptomyces sp. NPDC046324 TaxID=3154915 RepID=UPI00340DC635